MPFRKCWRQLLMRMMSPQIVGLVLFCLVGVVLNSEHPPSEHSNTFDAVRPHPTVRIRNPGVLKRRFLHVDSPGFNGLVPLLVPEGELDAKHPPSSSQSVRISDNDDSTSDFSSENNLPSQSLVPHTFRRIATDSPEIRNDSESSFSTFLHPSIASEISKQISSNKESPTFFSSNPLSVLGDSLKDSSNVNYKTSSYPLEASSKQIQRFSSKNKDPFPPLQIPFMYRVAVDVKVNNTNQNSGSDETESLEHAYHVPDTDEFEIKEKYKDFPLSPYRSFPIYKPRNNTPPFLYSQSRHIERIDKPPMKNHSILEISKTNDLFGDNSSSVESNNANAFESSPIAETEKADEIAHTYPKRKRIKNRKRLLSRSRNKNNERALKLSENQAYVYNETPPLSPTFHAKRYPKTDKSAKTAEQNPSLLFTHASSLKPPEYGEEIVVQSDNFEVLDPLLDEMTLQLKGDADSMVSETLSVPSKTVNGHWTNMMRINSENNKNLHTEHQTLNDPITLSASPVPNKFFNKNLESNYPQNVNKNSTHSQMNVSPKSEVETKNTTVEHDGREDVPSETLSLNSDDPIAKNKKQLSSRTNYTIRQGRNRNLFKIENATNQIGNETVPKYFPYKFRNASNLFNYTYHISALERGSLFPYDAFEDEEDKRSLFDSGFSISRSDKLSNKTRKQSLYEALRPRLKQSTNDSDADKLPLVSSSKHALKYNSTAIENTPKNLEEDYSNSDHHRDGSFLNVNNRTKNLDSINNFKKRADASLSAESLLKNLRNISSLLSRSSSRRIPTLTTRNSSIRSNNNENTTNTIKIYKLQDNSSRSEGNFDNESNSTTVLLKSFNTPTSGNDNSQNEIITNTTPVSVDISEDSITMLEEQTTNRPESTTQLPETDVNRRPKMTGQTNNENDFKRPKLTSKTFYDHLMKTAERNDRYNFSLPEFRPGNFYRYDGLYPRKPVLDAAYTRPPPFFKVRTSTVTPVTEKPTTFESQRTTVRVSSTFYPNRMQDATLRFGHSPTTPVPSQVDEPDEFRDPLEGGFTMEKLAYLLIGTCCGLSVLCLVVVVVAIKCRRRMVENRIKAHFRSRMFPRHDPRSLKEDPWLQHQMYDPFLYPGPLLPPRDASTRSSNTTATTCNCNCTTWSLGPRNLDSRPAATNRSNSSQYLCGQKKLPFGAASTLRFESMLGRKRPAPKTTSETHHPPAADSSSSPESDSLEHEDSSVESTHCPRRCTCISYNLWPVHGDVRRGMYGMCPGHYVTGDCGHPHQDDCQPIPRDCPPPVTGSNYLDRSGGLVFWSSNDERLI